MKKADDVKVAATTLRVQFSAKENRDAVGVRMKAAGWTVFDCETTSCSRSKKLVVQERVVAQQWPRNCELRNRHLLTL